MAIKNKEFLRSLMKFKREVAMEIFNYSKYKATHKVKINKYLSEDDTHIKKLCNGLYGRRTLLISGTGSGKTYTVLNELKNIVKKYKEQKFIFVVPNISNTQQANSKYNVGHACEDINVNEALSKNNIVAMTYNKFSQLKKDDLKDIIVFVDEIQTVYSEMDFRGSVMFSLRKALKNCKAEIHITATPSKLNFSEYNTIIEYEQKDTTKYNTRFYNQIDDRTILEVVEKAKGKVILYRQDISYLNYIKSKFPQKKVGVLESNGRYITDIYDMIINDSNIGDYDVLCTTGIIKSGTDIIDKDITDIIVINVTDRGDIKQISARARGLKEVNLHIFEKVNAIESKVFKVEEYIEEYLEGARRSAKALNDMYEIGLKHNGILDDIPSIKLDGIHFAWDKEERKLLVNEDCIRAMAHKRYERNADMYSRLALLNEYFPNIELIKIKAEDVDNKESEKFSHEMSKYKEESIEDCMPHLNKLVGVCQVLDNKISKELQDYIDKNNIDIQETLNISDILNIQEMRKNGMSKIFNVYTDNVIKRNIDYEVAMSMATMNGNKRELIWKSLQNVYINKLEELYTTELSNNNRPEAKIRRLIIEHLEKSGVSIHKTGGEEFVKYIASEVNGYKLSYNNLMQTLSIMYKMEYIQYSKGTPIPRNLLYGKILYKGGIFDRKCRVYTIGDRLTISDIVEMYDLPINANEVFEKVIENKLNKVEIRLRFDKMKITKEEFEELMYL